MTSTQDKAAADAAPNEASALASAGAAPPAMARDADAPSLAGLLAALRAVAEPTRLRLVALCAKGELTVRELTQILGQSQPRVSRHLKLLSDAGLLDRFRESSWVFYHLAAEGEGGRIARRVVDMIPADDATIALDGARWRDNKAAREARAAEYFRRNAARWDQVRSLHIDEAEVESALCDMAPAPRVDHLLDIGCGAGRMLELFADRAARAVGVDISSEMLAVARANLERAGLRHCGVRKGDMYRLPVGDATFDLVVVNQVLHFADDPARVVAEAGRALRPGGWLLLADFAPHEVEALRDEHAHRRLGFNDDQVRAWCAAAGMTCAPARRLAGEPLTVCVWRARRRRATA